MDRKPLKPSHFARLLVIAFIFSSILFLVRSRWSYFFSDRLNENVVFIPSVKLIPFPATNETLRQVQLGTSFPSEININISNPQSRLNIDFRTQFKELANQFFTQVLKNRQSYIFYFDVDREMIQKLKNPKLVFYGISSRWNLYFDDIKIDGTNDLQDTDIIIPITFNDRLPKRVIFYATPSGVHEFSLGLYDWYGLSIRSGVEAKWVVSWLINQIRYYYLVLCLSFGVIAVLILTLYFFQSPKDYRDVLAFGTYSGFLALSTFTKLPLFYDEFNGSGNRLSAIKLVIFASMNFNLAYLCITFFRLENDRKINVHLLLTILITIIIGIIYLFFPGGNNAWETGCALLSVLTMLFGAMVFWIGIKRILEGRHNNIVSGLPELNLVLKRRFWEIITFAISILMSNVFYTIGYLNLSIASNLDLWLFWSLVPTVVLLFQFQMMVGRGAAESKKLKEKLSPLETLVDTGSPAVFDKNYEVVIMTVDVKGFTTMQFLETLSDDVRVILMEFVREVSSHFEFLFSKYNQFHKKDGGDEWMFLMRPKEMHEELFRELFLDVYETFRNDIDGQIILWKADLEKRLNGSMDSAIILLLKEKFSVHASLVKVNDLRLDVGKGRSEKGDFKSPMYSLLKGIEKDATHRSLAMYKDQAQWLILSPEFIYEPKQTKIHDELRILLECKLLSEDKIPKIGILHDNRMNKNSKLSLSA